MLEININDKEQQDGNLTNKFLPEPDKSNSTPTKISNNKLLPNNYNNNNNHNNNNVELSFEK